MMSKLNIKVTMLMFLIIMVVVFSIVLILLQARSNQNLAQMATKQTFQNIAQQASSAMLSYDAKSEQLINLLETAKNADTFPTQSSNVWRFMVESMKYNPFIYSFYIGSKKGEFYQVINLRNINNLNAKLKAPQNAHWDVVQIQKAGEKTQTFLDENLKVINTIKSVTNYNASLRPWFLQSSRNKGITKTKPYVFTSLDDYGITYSKRINKNLTIGLDVAIKSLNSVLEQQKLVKGSEVFIFSQTGQIVAHRKIGVVSNNINGNIDRYYSKKHLYLEETKTPELVTIMDKQYFKYYSALSSKYDESEYILILSPLEEILKPYEHNGIIFLLISLGVFLVISIPFGIYLYNFIVRPIHAIKVENDKVNNDPLHEVKHVPSFISELDGISFSLHNMSNNINEYKSFQKELIKAYNELYHFFELAQSNQTEELALQSFSDLNKTQMMNVRDYLQKNNVDCTPENISAWLKKGGFIL